jgi:acyl-coenzyme A thioesterase PaaI-like protein
MARLNDMNRTTNALAAQIYDYLFSRAVKALGLGNFSVAEGEVSANLRHTQALQRLGDVACEQALATAVEAMATLAVWTTNRQPKDPVYQYTHFLRPAKDTELRIAARVLQLGGESARVEIEVKLAKSRQLATRARAELAF